MIELKGLTKKYGKKVILDSINAKFPNNEINFLMGKNGSGKTTLLKCISGLEKYNGTVNKDLQKTGGMLVIWDDCPFYTDMSGLDNLIIFDERNRKKIRY